jgi:hypothetical protein
MDCTLRGDLAHTIDTTPACCQGILERIFTVKKGWKGYGIDRLAWHRA